MSDYKTKLNILDHLLKNNESSLKHKIIKFLDWKHCEGCNEKFESDKMYHPKDFDIWICNHCLPSANYCCYAHHYFFTIDKQTICPDCELDRDIDWRVKQYRIWQFQSD